MTDDPVTHLREVCPNWSDRHLAEMFGRGSAGFASPEAWRIVRLETLKRGLATDAIANALESGTPIFDRVLDGAFRLSKGWGLITWFLTVAVVGALLATAAMTIAGLFR